MNLVVNPAPDVSRPTIRQQPRVVFLRTCLTVVAFVGAGLLAAACGGGPTASTGASAAASGRPSNAAAATALAYIDCMRTHGEPNMPEPSVSGKSVHIAVTPGSGVDPSSPQFAHANAACKHLLPNNGAPTANTITEADQADYLKAAACMRAYGVPNFPDPDFVNGSVEFSTKAPIDTSSSQYEGALATCQKLIPAGLPYSSGS